MVSLKGLTAGYGSTTVVRDLSMELPTGSRTCLLGRNGAGKSTLVKSMLGLLPHSGEATLLDRSVERSRPDQIMALGVGYAPQEAAIFHELTVQENLIIACRGRGLRRDSIREGIAPFPVLGERLEQRAGSLSGGEQKMLILARALLGPPRLVVLDEVSEGVQPSVLDIFRGVIDDVLGRSGATLLIVEQNVAFGLSVASRFVVMESGEVVDAGPVGEGTATDVQRHLVL